MLAAFARRSREAARLRAVTRDRDRLAGQLREARAPSEILESITDAFFAVDPLWRFTYVNREAERLLRRSRETLLGRNVWEEFPEATYSRFLSEYERAMVERKAVHFEEFYPPLGIWFEVKATPSPTGLSIFFHDVSARKQAEERLRESEARYRLLADMVPQQIWTSEPDGSLTYFSRRWYEFANATFNETRGERWIRFIHPEDRERTLKRWNRSLKSGEPYAIEYRVRGGDGKYHWFLAQATPRRGEAGEILEWFGTLTDISERMRHEAEREQLLQNERHAHAEAERRREQLERMTESRAGLMRGFGHDVKNSLGTALVAADMLERRWADAGLPDNARANVDRIRRSIHGAIRLIDDLLDIARAEAGQLEFECVETDVGALAREAVGDFRAQASAAGQDLALQSAEPMLASVDPARLRQILVNLLSNAVKHAVAGPVRVTATLQATGGPGPGEWIAASVTDSGPGIPSGMQESIFEEYVRLDPKASPGSGIGLAISRRIARLMGGDLSVESELGHGSTFTLWLPARCGRNA